MAVVLDEFIAFASRVATVFISHQWLAQENPARRLRSRTQSLSPSLCLCCAHEPALKVSGSLPGQLLDRQMRDNDGAYPESIAFVLWGTDNIKTYGESLAQVLWMVGVRPLPDSLGRVNRIRHRRASFDHRHGLHARQRGRHS